MSRKKRVLVFEDFESIRNILVKTLEKKDVDLVIAYTLSDALQELNGTGFNLIITDFDNKNNSAFLLIKHLRETTSYLFTPIALLITGSKDQYLEKTGDFNIASYLTKPFDMNLFNSVIDRFC
jgi:DNA-binding response OmpR family regulator